MSLEAGRNRSRHGFSGSADQSPRPLHNRIRRLEGPIIRAMRLFSPIIAGDLHRSRRSGYWIARGTHLKTKDWGMIQIKAFSSEVGAGSREENASK
jgi:hypothetical protein